MSDLIIDPLSERYALAGRVVTMDDKFTVLDSGIVYIDAGRIVGVRKSTSAPPKGFQQSPVLQTNGTIYPGLIELHNHLTYNILPLWNVPKKFQNRDEWRDHIEKRKLITAPMRVLGKTPGYVEAIIRYVECKCLVAGVTTSQGISLYGIATRDYYRGVVRNVESPVDPALKRARTRVGDIDKDSIASVSKELKRLQDRSCYLLHLSEGVDPDSLKHFNVLKLDSGEWAITNALSGIHSLALKEEHFKIMAAHNASMVWSPLSNLLLYGQTAEIQAAKRAGVLISIGSDWSPTGSKNILCELKVAHLMSQLLGQDGHSVFEPREIVAMVTSNAAKIVKWDNLLGSLDSGKRADLLIINNVDSDPYDALIRATEHSIRLVVINGVPRFGQMNLMGCFGNGTKEPIEVGGEIHVLNLWEETADPRIRDLTLTDATKRLQHGFAHLVELARRLELPSNVADAIIAELARHRTTFNSLEEAYATINLPQVESYTNTLDPERPPIFLKLEMDEFDTSGGMITLSDMVTPDSELLGSVIINLDPITVFDDTNYFTTLNNQNNLVQFIKDELSKYYDS